MVVVLLGLSFHEFAHAKFADMAGDDTPRLMGRVTLNPLAHLDPIGTIMIVMTSLTGIGIGWGKPVMVRPDRMRNPRWDHFVSVLAGPMSNLVQAVVYGVVLKLAVASGAPSVLTQFGPIPDGIYGTFLVMGVLVNVSLCLFNLIPLGPLDGHWLVGAFMPDPMRLNWYRFNRGIGAFIFLLLVLIPSGSAYDILGNLFYPAVMKLAGLIL